MTLGPEQFVVIWFDEGRNLYAVSNPDHSVVTRTSRALRGTVHGTLSTEEEIHEATPRTRYAVPTSLAADVFGWDV